jgi:hypothetical protein
MTAEKADQAIIVTTGNFTRDAQDFAFGKPVTWLMAHNSSPSFIPFKPDEPNPKANPLWPQRKQPHPPARNAASQWASASRGAVATPEAAFGAALPIPPAKESGTRNRPQRTDLHTETLQRL